MRPPAVSHARSTTLAERLVGLAIRAILAAAAWPAFHALLARQTVNHAADRLAASLARSTAMSRRVEVVLEPLDGRETLDHGWRLVAGDSPGRAWNHAVTCGPRCAMPARDPAPDRARQPCAPIHSCGILSIGARRLPGGHLLAQPSRRAAPGPAWGAGTYPTLHTGARQRLRYRGRARPAVTLESHPSHRLPTSQTLQAQCFPTPTTPPCNRRSRSPRVACSSQPRIRASAAC